MKTQEKSLNVYYDGACHLCSREVAAYLAADSENTLRAVDISAADFDAQAEGLNKLRANKYFHVKTADGRVLEGVEAFSAIWDTLGVFKRINWVSKTKFGKPVMNFFYKIFAEIRPLLPKRKDCQSCKI